MQPVYMKKIIRLIGFSLSLLYAGEKEIITTLLESVTVSPSIRQTLQDLITDTHVNNDYYNNFVDLPLVKACPGLYGAFPYVVLGNLTTPVEHLQTCGEVIGLQHLYIKRDDQAEKDHFGGNKRRKLSFLLGDALAQNVPAVITVGAAGSNHAVATADYAKLYGLPSHLFLIPQRKGAAICRNLLWSFSRDARLMVCPTKELRDLMLVATMLDYKQTTGFYPYFIPTGGSCPLGTLGFVNAAFELRDQILAGELPEPRYIYVALGSGGTVAGLVLGLRAAGLQSRVIAVAVEPSDKQHWYTRIINLAQRANELLCNADETFPCCHLDERDFDIVTGFCGDRYGVTTKLANDAQNILNTTHSIMLDITYTAKAFSALIEHARTGVIEHDMPVLFWHTYCADDLPDDAKAIDYHALPKALHGYCTDLLPA